MTRKRGDAGGHGGFAQTGPSNDRAMVQALLPLWAGRGIVPAGTVYELEAAAAWALAAQGLVRVLGAGDASADLSMTEPDLSMTGRDASADLSMTEPDLSMTGREAPEEVG